MPNALASSICCAAWMIASAALAQSAAPPPAAAPSTSTDTSGSTAVSGVVVEGKASPAALKAFAEAVDRFVKAQGKPGPIGQVSRWHDPVCPTTEGLDPEVNAFVSARVKAVAERIGAPDGECQDDNVRVVFTPDPDAFMADVRDNSPEVLGFHYPSETKALAVFQPPMKSWYVTASRFTAKLTGAGIDPSKEGAVDAEGPSVTTWACTGTHIRCEKASDLNQVLVVVDSTRIEGFPIDAVADDVAMVALSRPGAREGCSVLPSVMDALNRECQTAGPIEGLTAYDESYLKGLYAYQGSEITAFVNNAIAKSMIKDTRPAPRNAAPSAHPSCDRADRLSAC